MKACKAYLETELFCLPHIAQEADLGIVKIWTAFANRYQDRANQLIDNIYKHLPTKFLKAINKVMQTLVFI